jgi:hypothetical protein
MNIRGITDERHSQVIDIHFRREPDVWKIMLRNPGDGESTTFQVQAFPVPQHSAILDGTGDPPTLGRNDPHGNQTVIQQKYVTSLYVIFEPAVTDSDSLLITGSIRIACIQDKFLTGYQFRASCLEMFHPDFGALQVSE